MMTKEQLPPSEFCVAVRDRLGVVLSEIDDEDRWTLSRREKCVTARFNLFRLPHGQYAQLWIPRPENGRVRCTFEIATRPSVGVQSEFLAGDIGQREAIADTVRQHIFQSNPPAILRESRKSTICRVPIRLPANSPLTFVPVLQEIEEFLRFLDGSLQTFNMDNLE